MKQQQFVVIGLGRFGASLALELMDLGYEVLGIDRDEEVVDELSSQLTHAVTADATDEEVLKSLGIRNFDCGVVAIGNEIPLALELEMLLRQGLQQRGLDPGPFYHPQRRGVEKLEEIALALVRCFMGKQAVVQAHGGLPALAGRHPLDNPLGLDAICRVFADGIGHGARMHCYYRAAAVFDRACGKVEPFAVYPQV